MVVTQGDIFWVDFGPATGSAPAYLRPCVVVQTDYFNRRLNTVAVCVLTTTLARSSDRGNVLLDLAEGNLSRQSVVNVSQLETIDKRDLGEKIGTLGPDRVRQILAGVQLVLAPPRDRSPTVK